jgi:hypothetical protein
MRSLPATICASVLLAACAGSAQEPAKPAPEQASSGAEAAAAEQARLEAIRRHPIAQPEPRPALPEQRPPERPERGLPQQSPPPRERGEPSAAPAPRDEEPAAETRSVVTSVEPPAEPIEQPRPARPRIDYVWAPGYWYWYGGEYVWIGGAWVPPRAGYSYVGARWVFTSHGWTFVPGGWALGVGTTVVYPIHRHGYLYDPGYRHRHWDGHHHRDHHHHGDYRRSDRRSYRGASPNRTLSRPRSSSRPSGTTRFRGNRTSARPLR